MAQGLRILRLPPAPLVWPISQSGLFAARCPLRSEAWPDWLSSPGRTGGAGRAPRPVHFRIGPVAGLREVSPKVPRLLLLAVPGEY